MQGYQYILGVQVIKACRRGVQSQIGTCRYVDCLCEEPIPMCIWFKIDLPKA